MNEKKQGLEFFFLIFVFMSHLTTSEINFCFYKSSCAYENK